MFSLLLLLACGDDNKEPMDADGDGFTEDVDCDDSNPNVHTLQTRYGDGDGDGYGTLGSEMQVCGTAQGMVENALDCDDENADINPDADEICDAFDNDCDGEINNEAVDMVAYYMDADQDGFGENGSEVMACEAPEDHMEQAGDCDDDNEVIFPGADEVCDELDNNCDGTIDENALDALIFYVDTDGDGFGSSAETLACSLPESHSENNDDCDDGNIAIHPEADERCDGVDNDCDTNIDEDDSIDAVLFYVDADGDGDGDGANAVSACTQPAGTAPTDTDCDDANASIYTGAMEICDGIDNDCDASIPSDEVDGDGDGYVGCTYDVSTWMGSSLVVGGEDCDDTSFTTNPGADEQCATSIDDDCDGTINEGDAFDAQTWYADSDTDGFGDPDVSQMSCVQPSGYILDMQDCNDADAAINPDIDDIAANGVDEDCDGQDAQGIDGDGDGFLDTQDCNDADAAINPDASEICDELDNNCDGQIDEGVTTTFYMDNDGDAYGGVAVERCALEAGIVDTDGDCDDTDANIHPFSGSMESDPTLCMRDADNDGWGDSNPPLGVDSGTDCDDNDPSLHQSDNDSDGVTSCAGDCADGDSTIHPNITEICDSIDNNCDGQIDEGVQTTFYLDSDQDGFGDLLNSLEDCSVPSGYVVNSTDCNDGNATMSPSSTELCDGVDNDCDGSIPAAEQDDDSDGYVECFYQATTWMGSSLVVGGEDCDDGDALTYVGAAAFDSTSICMTDADEDGYGDDTPASGVDAGTDCDDSDETIFSAATEVYGDGIDQDCDGSDPEITTDWSEVETILSSNNCMACHGGSGGLTITYNNIVLAASSIGLSYIEPNAPSDSYLWHKINGTQSSVGGFGSNMANKGGVNLTVSDLSYIETWITQGAPKALSYSADIEPILSSNGCMGCHGGSGGLTISYNNIVNTSDPQTGLDYIEPGDASNSYLWHKINGTQSSVGGSGGKMGNMSIAQLSTIEEWIHGGAQP